MRYFPVLFVIFCVSCGNEGDKTNAKKNPENFTKEEAEDLAAILKESGDSISNSGIVEEVNLGRKQYEFMLFDEIDERFIRGIDSTVTTDFIIAELKKRSDLVPIKPVFDGSPMAIAEVALLKYPWAYCRVGDGHIEGYMLVEYVLKPGRKISFKVIKAYEDDR
jgi:hypothetical protein